MPIAWTTILVFGRRPAGGESTTSGSAVRLRPSADVAAAAERGRALDGERAGEAVAR
jgi:hypothetical protein